MTGIIIRYGLDSDRASIGERFKFQLRGEAFNVWNHPAFATPGTSYGTSSFGRVNDVANRANPARRIQLGAKLLW